MRKPPRTRASSSSGSETMPTGYNATGASVLQTLLDLVRGTGLAALIATHNLELARRLDRVVVLEYGRLRRVA